ncbi:RabGAP/TBC [Microstroma glucosiphilum]|uniref:RabGAP/TBC n=1 Tax=Pseudomicrostroma glucosiphilum TaxID=1684307 RepID=A0A316U4E3_9BASI|nr:RabGAP/TBC [Pseudomicrostroma glucosiphilum]PWN19654.1 RabGAP/TBC [Pseudomicrostroma glucosiphilum]
MAASSSSSSSATKRSASSSTSSVPTLSRLNIIADAFGQDDEDAWALDSDDEDFAKQRSQQQQQQQQGRSATGSTSSLRSPSLVAYPRGPTVERSFSSGSVTSNSSSSSSTSAARKHAPPARPHPFPLPTSSSSSTSKTTPYRASSLSQSQVPLSDRGRDDLRTDQSSNGRSSSSWTMVSDMSTAAAASTQLYDPSPSATPRNRSRSPTIPKTVSRAAAASGTASLAGSPPAELGSTAAEAVLQACMRDQGGSARGKGTLSPPLASPTYDSTSPTDMARSSSITSVGLEKKRDREAGNFTSSIRDEVMDIVRDPFVALECLTRAAAAASSSDSAFTASPTPTTAIQRQQEHTRNLGMHRGFNDLGGPGTPGSASASSSPQQLPRSASASSTNWKAGSRGRGFAPWSAKRQDSFDPLSIAGEGVTMSGRGWARNSSTTSLDKGKGAAGDTGDKGSGAEGDGETTPGGGQYLPLPSDAEGGHTLRREKSVRTKRRWREFFRCLEGGSSAAVASSASTVDLTKLRELSWNGIPSALRPIVWPLLLGYLPPNSSMRTATLARKRNDYRKAAQLAFGSDCFDEGENSSSSSTNKTGSPIPLAAHRKNTEEEKIWHQISIDVPRTNPSLPLWQRASTQRSLERLLYIWAIRHHATGYVQGMSDLATPFFQVFLSIYLQVSPDDEEEASAIEGETRRIEDVVEEYDPVHLPAEVLVAIEADTYWCLGKLLEGIQENYIFAQPGIVRQVRRMEELVGRIDAPLHAHLKAQGVEYMQFAFRWMNCLLMREVSVQNVTRLWDTYLAEGPDAFSDFHLYVCSVFLCKWSVELRGMDFAGCIMFLQALPTRGWGDKDAELLLSEAFVFKNLFGQTRHLGD